MKALMLDAADLDPDQGSLSSLEVAVHWIAQLLTGTLGTSIAVLTIAAVGLALLAGRMPVRRGISTIVGCFILFSSAEIAFGLTTGARELGGPAEIVDVPVIAPPPVVAPPAAYDPYAGASVPYRPPNDVNILPR